MELTVNQALTLIQEKINQVSVSPPIRNLARRQCRQLATNVGKLGIGGEKIISLPEPPPPSGKPSRRPKRSLAGRSGASITGKED